MDFDVVVIGAGPGGYAAAVRCAQLGLRAAIIEKGKNLGGTCMNIGCIPTKALLEAANVRSIVESSSGFGIESIVKTVDFEKVFSRASDVISTLNNGLFGLMEANGIKVINGTASFLNKNTVLISNENRVTAKNIVIATGALPKTLPSSVTPDGLLREDLVWTSKEALESKVCPRNIVIVGSGAIGIEFASFYNSMGSKVTVVEIQDRILVNEDEEIAKMALREFTEKGINFILKTSINKIQQYNNVIEVIYGNDKRKIFDAGLVAIGVVPNTKHLNLEKISVKTGAGGNIIVDNKMETSVKGIYAVGDITNPPFLAHKASREGAICAESIAGISETRPLDPLKIPACTYSNPQIASIGMTEKKAVESGQSIRIGKAYFKSNGKSMAIGADSGFIKVIFEDKTGELLGAHMIGHDVTEIISVFSTAISAELTDRELLNTVFPHPTISECIHNAVLNSLGRAA
ncbi:MAG: dihydrolipoyl dehydrogenase [Holosporales bacterium]|nr:dihydrolipoyl dehydrogenase [Holosporales bacterium]